MSRFGRQFVRTRELKHFERRLIKLVVERPGALNASHEALFRYASILARMHLMRTPTGHDVPVRDEVDALRQWMIDTVVPMLPEDGEANITMLRQLAKVLAVRVEDTRTTLLENHVQDFGPEHLDDEIRNKKLVLSLGGGGGAGLAHLGTFAMFNELGHVPELIVGSSMGALMGALRAIDRDYDPISTALALPRDIAYNTVFRPFSGYSRFGFPGAFHMNLLRVSRQVFHNLIGQSTLEFSQLPIKLQVVACGIRTGFHIDDDDYVASNPQDLSLRSIRSKLRMFFKVVRQISQNPRFLAQIVFGKELDTLSFPVVEAVGFSCAVPGLLHYDVYHDDPSTIGPLEDIFERHQLLRLCDGGVVNNVPSGVAWDSVQSGVLESRNTFIFGADVFAPISSGRNLLWVPIQQIARPAVVANRPYADFHKTFRSPPSPLQVIVNKYSRLKQIVQAARDELADDVPFLRRALTPLPPYGLWNT